MEDRLFLASEAYLAPSSDSQEAVLTAPFDPRWLSGGKVDDSSSDTSNSESSASSSNSSSSAVVAVFDGHAGSGGADFCARKLPSALEVASTKPTGGQAEQQEQQAPWLKSLASALAPAGIGAIATTSDGDAVAEPTSPAVESSSSATMPPSNTSAAAVAAVAGAWRELCQQWGHGDGSGAVGTIALVTPDNDISNDGVVGDVGAGGVGAGSNDKSSGGGVVVAVANCGDSRAVLLEFTEPFGGAAQDPKAAAKPATPSAKARAPPAAPVIVAAQTAEHRTDNPDELARLVKGGGKVACDRGKDIHETLEQLHVSMLDFSCISFCTYDYVILFFVCLFV